MQGNTFYRPARSYPPLLPGNEIVVPAPPVIQASPRGIMAWLQYLLPALGGMGAFIFILAYPTNLFIVFAALLMGAAMIASGLAMGIVQRQQGKKQRKLQRERYLTYLSHLRKRLSMIEQEQYRVNARLYPSYREMEDLVGHGRYLWERRPADRDFTDVRIGLGPRPLCCPLRLDTGGADFMIRFMPEMLTQAESLIAEYGYLDDLPATIRLDKLGILTVSSPHQQAQALVRALLCQLVVFQSPEDVRCLVYYPSNQTPDWEWLKWLPHIRRLRQVKMESPYAPEQLCLLAHTAEDLSSLLQQQIKPEMERRQRLFEDKENQQQGGFLPHLIIVLDGYSPHSALGQVAELNTLFSQSQSLGVTIICVVNDESQEPVQVGARLSISAVGDLAFEELHYGGLHLEGLLPDTIDLETCERIARRMAPLTLGAASVQEDFSQDVHLLNLLEIPAADALDPAITWLPRTRADLLRVPFGKKKDGSLVYLDLKETADRGMGPHGLIVGATGSGKSELLRTLVVALAITHDPQTLNLVLIDFKGGASFADFDALPQVAGIVTNLQSDLMLVDRVYSALLGEQQRRQRMLHDAGNLDNIKQYQEVWARNHTIAPMPHLIIIVDEFAELIANRSDFLDLFVQMGRVGRSLGIHLLFATQRLEEGRIKGLESHLRYRICLRTYSASESKTVLEKADAYYLPSMPGMGYFKVDTEIYDLFKAGLVSVPHVSLEEKALFGRRPRLFTSAGKLVQHPDADQSERGRVAHTLRTEMDVVIERLALASQKTTQSKAVHQVWLPPLEKVLPFGQVLQRTERMDLDGTSWGMSPVFGDLRVPVGLLDIPLKQEQIPCWLDFSGIGGHLALVGAPRSGKSTFLRTLITAFLLTHSPRDVQIYGIDMGGGLLHIFEQAPHVGATCGKAERDKVRRVVRQVRQVIEEREFFFRERGIDTMATLRARRQNGEFPDMPFGDIFLLIDNFGQFFLEFDQLEADLLEIIANGLSYGVHLVLTANRWAEIRTKLRDNIGTRLELRLNDPQESELGKATASALPIDTPGRGATRDKLFFQVALPLIERETPTLDQLNTVVQQSLNNLVQRICLAWKGEPAPPVYMLPSRVSYEDLPPPEKQTGVPLALEEFRLSPLSIDLVARGPHFIILGDSESGKTSLLRTWMRGIERAYEPQEAGFAIVDFRKQLLDFAESRHLLGYAYNALTLATCIGNLKTDLERRLQKSTDVPLSELGNTSGWNGRHFFLFVDDSENVQTSGSNPLNPLVDYILSARDIGFHIILSHRVGGMGRAAYEAMFQRLREMGTSAIILSGDPAEGKLLYGVPARYLPPGRGYFVQPKYPPILVQTAFSQSIHTHK